jgi:hypothetical protein
MTPQQQKQFAKLRLDGLPAAEARGVVLIKESISRAAITNKLYSPLRFTVVDFLSYSYDPSNPSNPRLEVRLGNNAYWFTLNYHGNNTCNIDFFVSKAMEVLTRKP